MHKIRIKAISALFLILLLAFNPVNSLPAEELLRFAPPSEQESAWLIRDLIHRLHAGRHAQLAPREEQRVSDYDVLHYDLELAVDEANQTIDGLTGITIRSLVSALDQVTVHLHGLTVNGIELNGTPLTFSRNGEDLIIDLDRPYGSDEEFTLSVDYAGHPAREAWGGFWFIYGMAYNMGVGLYTDPPSMGRYWFPCLDEPDDKASFTAAYTVPAGDMAVGNGLLTDVVEHPLDQTVTYTWTETHPVSTYLICIAVADWVEIADPVYPELIRHYVLPEDSLDAIGSFQNVHHMMDAYTQAYGPYQFDKFSYVGVNNGDMEHVTCVAHVRTLINGYTYYDTLLAHEMSHHWWGNWVTIADWRDIWLSEGFATYSEAVYKEYIGGAAAYHSEINSIMNYYLNSGETFPIYDPVQMWGATSYEKGASVLHMLRHIIGDDDFFDLFAAWGEAYGFSNAVSQDFADLASSVSGQDLSVFFDDWLYQPGYPIYDWSWTATSGSGVDTLVVYVDQAQVAEEGWPLFAMPVDIEVETAAGSQVFTAVVDQAHERFTFVLPEPALAAELDPERWVLCVKNEGVTAVQETSAYAFSLLPAGPNPFSATTAMRLSTSDPLSPVAVDVYDCRGRLIRRLFREPIGGSRIIEWNGLNEQGSKLASGVYFMRAEQSGSVLTHRVILLH